MRSLKAHLGIWLLGLAMAGALRADENVRPDSDIFQYRIAAPDGKSAAAYLWVPPEARVIRAVMVGIHNGLPATILQNPAVRKVCEEYGIAQVLLIPNGSDIGTTGMLKDLNFDITDPARTEIYDRYIQALADVSSHPELALAPVIPLAHSAYCSFPLELALRDASRCLMAIPIKAGLPNIYSFYAEGGKAMHPAPSLTMESVPILFVTSLNQSTVPSAWKTQAVPYGSGSSGHPQTYRDDTDDNPGDNYKKGNELFGINWEMMSCHFDMMPRNSEFIARYIAAVSRARLPDPPPAPGTKPVLKPLTLDSGWLVDRFYSNTTHPTAGKPGFEPAPYREYKGPKNQAFWYPNEELARTTWNTMVGESTRKFEMFTILDREGQPLSLAESPQVNIPDAGAWVDGGGHFTLKIHPFTEPFLVCTNTARGHEKDPAAEHPMENRIFPGQTTLPVSDLPVRVDVNGSPVELTPGDGFTFRLKPHRLAPEPGGYNQFYLHFYKEGNQEFAVAGRSVRVEWYLNGRKIPGIKDQKITFEPLPDVPKPTRRLKLGAISSSGLPVSYFVREGPAAIEGDELVVTQVPAADPRPIRVTVAAYQPGLWQPDGFRAAPTVYQSFFLTP